MENTDLYAMCRLTEQNGKSVQEPNVEEDREFCWGLRTGTILYESFRLDGVDYSLYDCVYMWRTGQAKPDVGKLVRICEMENNEKKVEVVWFYRPSEIAQYSLGDHIKPLERELFLACGLGRGVSNVNPLEAISGKCNVVCSSKHERNPQPTEEELRMADYIFYRTFDVGRLMISEDFPNSIREIEVDHFFNRRKCANPSVSFEPKAHAGFNVSGTSTSRQMNDSTKARPCPGAGLEGSEGLRDDALLVQEEHIITVDPCSEKATKFTKKS